MEIVGAHKAGQRRESNRPILLDACADRASEKRKNAHIFRALLMPLNMYIMTKYKMLCRAILPIGTLIKCENTNQNRSKNENIHS